MIPVDKNYLFALSFGLIYNSIRYFLILCVPSHLRENHRMRSIKFIFMTALFIYSAALVSAQENPIKIKFVGDIVAYSDFPKDAFPIPSKIADLLDPVTALLQDKDLLIGNLEGPITSSRNLMKILAPGRNTFAFRFPPDGTPFLLKKNGFDIMHIANNHMRDFGESGFQDTIAYLAKYGIDHTGVKNQITYKTIGQTRIAVIGFFYSEGMFNDLHNQTETEQLLKKARAEADILVVTAHAGAEGLNAKYVKNQEEIFYGERRGNLVLFAHHLIDHGADAVVMSGPHVLRGMELYRDKTIAYSLGNFMGYGGALSIKSELKYSVILELVFNASGQQMGGKIIPLIIGPNGIPTLDAEKNSISFIRDLSRHDFKNTAVDMDDDGNFVLNGTLP